MESSFEKYREKLSRDYYGAYGEYAEGLDDDAICEAAERIKEEEKNSSPVILMAKLEAFILKNSKISINPYEYFAGSLGTQIAPERIRYERHRENMKDLSPHTRKIYLDGCSTLSFTAGPDYGHTAPYWDDILKLGFCGLLERVRENSSKCHENDIAKREFYLSCEIVFEGVFVYIERLASLAERVSALQNNSFAKDNLINVANTLRSIATHPPKTLREAMQMILTYYSLQHKAELIYVRTLGPLDALLYPFMVSDIENGILDGNGVREYLRAFLYACNAEKVAANIPFAIAGLYKNGESRANEMSYIILEEYMKLDIHDPKIHFCYSPKTPEKLVRLALESIRQGKNSIVFINCENASNALTALGEDREDTVDFTIVGCYELAAYGKEVPCSVNGYINLAKALEASLFRGHDLLTDKTIGPDTGDISSFDTFDKLYDAYFTQLFAFADESMHIVSSYEKYYPVDVISPLLSSTYEYSVKRGVDAYHGGAKYNSSSLNALGIATVADSLYAIKKLVYDEKRLTLTELAEILRTNWENNEELRTYISAKIPKYGNNNDDVDFFAKDIIAKLGKHMNGRPNGRGGSFRLGTFSIDCRFTFGEKTGASADGRHAGETLSKNMCATTACDVNGITAHILSACKVDYSAVPNGTVLDLVLHASAAKGEDGMTALVALLRTFMLKGGFAVQFNILSLEQLKEAQKHPEKYQTLQVRLCGWNVKFCNLSKKEQDEYILQCEKVGNF